MDEFRDDELLNEEPVEKDLNLLADEEEPFDDSDDEEEQLAEGFQVEEEEGEAPTL